jgi:hypothetical protein
MEVEARDSYFRFGSQCFRFLNERCRYCVRLGEVLVTASMSIEARLVDVFYLHLFVRVDKNFGKVNHWILAHS